MFLFPMLIAILPVIGLLVYIYKMDSYEKEPIGLLVKLVILGVLSAIPAIILEGIMDEVLKDFSTQGSYLYLALSAFFGVACVEELVKFLAAYFSTWKNPAFNFKFDGIVYCFYASMGFALIENIFYVFGGNSPLSVAIPRAFLAIPAHGMFSVFMGYNYGEAKYCSSLGNKSGCHKAIARGYITAVLLHGFYDFCLFTKNMYMVILFFIFVIIADIITVIKIRNASRQNHAIYNTPTYQQYWVNPANMYPGAPGQYYPAQAPASQGMYIPGQNFAPQGQQGQYRAGQNFAPQGQQRSGQNFASQGQQDQYRAGQNFASQGQQDQYQQGQYRSGQNFASQGQQGQYRAGQNFAPQGQPAAADQAEGITKLLKREAPRLVYCPTCGNICNFNSFFCGKCSTPIHSYGG